uniref:Chromatin modification-related protein MEAF6 n=1 Tax=Trichuris muris TaxID=70415 RepID=A0A5S6QWE6_TRIMR
MATLSKKELAAAFASAQSTVDEVRRLLQSKKKGEGSILGLKTTVATTESERSEARNRMLEALKRRSIMEAALAEAERIVYEKEENYLLEFQHIGTVITGFQPMLELRSSNGSDPKSSRARKRRHSISDAHRLFSWTSSTSGVEIDEAQLIAFKKKDNNGSSDDSVNDEDRTLKKSST